VGHTFHQVAITHEGVKERDEAIEGAGATRTAHFAAEAILTVVQSFHGPVGAVQTGGQGSVANVTQTIGMPSGDVLALAEQLRAKALEHGDEDAIVAAEKAHQHARAGNVEKVRFYTESLKTIAALAPLANAVLSALAGVGA
jgi:hypothetical protein